MNRELITLKDGNTVLQISPATGGAIVSYHSLVMGEAVNWLKPTDAAALLAGDATQMSCFPLFPYSNRIRNGRFSFQGQNVQLPVSEADPHFEHGHGWRNSWDVTSFEKNRAVLSYLHEPDAWPWRYNAQQEFLLENGALNVNLSIQNLSETPMPAGFGLHPYFPASPNTRIEASIRGMWEVDDQVLPTHHTTLPNGLVSTKISDMNFDNVFTGWDQRARVVWPDEDRHLDMLAETPLSYLVLYTPTGEDHFCAEPVSNCTDAFNSDDPATGQIILSAGETAQAMVSFVPKIF